MKKIFITLFTGGLFLVACGQKITPPREVQDAFAIKFRSVQNITWEQEENGWEAEFKMNGTEVSASFDNAGKWMETETEMNMKDLPAEICKTVILQFNGWEIEEVESIEKPEFKGYEMELEKGGTETEILVSLTGSLTVKKVKVGDDEDEDSHNNDN